MDVIKNIVHMNEEFKKLNNKTIPYYRHKEL